MIKAVTVGAVHTHTHDIFLLKERKNPLFYLHKLKVKIIKKAQKSLKKYYGIKRNVINNKGHPLII